MKARILILVLVALVHTPSGGCSTSSFNDVTSLRRSRRQTPNTSKSVNSLWNATWTDKLKQDLLFNYDKFARPSQPNKTTYVNLGLVIRHLELDEQRSVLTIHSWVKMYWTDEKLKWDSSKYNGLKELHLADHEVWQPDVLPYNSATGSTIDHYGNTNLIAFVNGTVLWVPPSIFHVFCQLDFRRWPFDTQNCSIKFGSWTYNGEQVDLLNDGEFETVYTMPELIPNSEWEFVEMSGERNSIIYPCCPVPYPDLTFYVTIRRQSATYQALVITPVSVIVLMILATFWLPPTSDEKIPLAAAAVIVNSLFVLYFTQKMPSMSNQVPYVVSFYCKCLYLGAFAVVIAVAVINLARNPKNSPLPWILKRNLTGWLGKCLLVQNSNDENSLKSQEMTDSHPVLSEQDRHPHETSSKSNQRDWILVANAVDRIFFLIYSASFVILALVYSV